MNEIKQQPSLAMGSVQQDPWAPISASPWAPASSQNSNTPNPFLS